MTSNIKYIGLDVHKESIAIAVRNAHQLLDALRTLRQEVRRDLLAESKKHKVWKRLYVIPSMGPIRAAGLLGILQTPHRLRTKAAAVDLLRARSRDQFQR